MNILTLLGLLAFCLASHGQLTDQSIGSLCNSHDDCSAIKCEFGGLAACYGACVCEAGYDRGDQFMYKLISNINRYTNTHCTGKVLRRKRSMTHNPSNRLSRKIADTIKFEESKINKRSVKNIQSSQEVLLDALSNCGSNSSIQEMQSWFSLANSLRLLSPADEMDFFRDWNNFIRPFSKDTLMRDDFTQSFKRLQAKDVVTGLSKSKAFQKLFWPFVYDIAFMNQKLAVIGLTGNVVPSRAQKSVFYSAVEKIQDIRVPVIERQVVYSFDNKNLVNDFIHYDNDSDNMAVNNTEKFTFDLTERKEIIRKTDAAMELIKQTMPEVYRGINQLIGCFAFYKAEDRAHISGSMNAAIGIIWFDPSATEEWTIPFYAEQIVHEYIHTSLYMAEMVHGMFSDHTKLSQSKVMSSIRLEKRDYDKSFHACYVSTGLVAFHAQAGFWTRAQSLAETIDTTMNELIAINQADKLLSHAGEATLNSMKDFLTVIRLVD
ncbi:hypothetical protein ACF0H5_003243 [Mactra antiquata]